MAENWAFGGGPTPLDTGSLVTLVEGSSFCISSDTGDIHPGSSQGLFVRDTRFLSRWELRIDGQTPQALSVTRDDPYSATYICRSQPSPGKADSSVLVLRRRYVGNGMREDIELHNLGAEATACSVVLLIDADFADIFEVKENRVSPRGESVTATAEAGGVRFSYRWMGMNRGLRVTCDPAPQTSPGLMTVQVVLPPRGIWHAGLRVYPLVDTFEYVPEAGTEGSVDQTLPARRLREWRAQGAVVRTRDAALMATVRRSKEDLGSLRIFDPDHPDRVVIAAGAPWFMTLFGRDSLLTSWMALPIDPRIALGTVQTLAGLQGRRNDPVTEEQPGRILHEIRTGMASATALGGSSVYYGTADATALFVMLLGELRRWGVEPAEVNALLPAADRALAWIDDYGDADGDGFVEYRRMTDGGLVNQGWKDSWDGVSFADGTIARAPIALCEVQAYTYAAFLARAEFARDAGDTELVAHCVARAEKLKLAFNDAFWLPELGYYALALDGHKNPVDAVASNMGHCLWTGIVDDDKAAAVAEHLLSPEMFSGWGVRTLSTAMAAYNPMSYHNGSVWPHDNAVIAAGLMRYGFVEQAQRVAVAMLEAAEAFGGRLPELFCGFDRDSFTMPVPYPTSCSPQAWAAATPIHLLRTLLRCDPDLPGGQLFLAPVLPDQLLPIDVERLPFGDGHLAISVDHHGFRVTGLPDGVTEQRDPRPQGRR